MSIALTAVFKEQSLHVRLGLVGLCPRIHCLSSTVSQAYAIVLPCHLWIQGLASGETSKIVLKHDATLPSRWLLVVGQHNWLVGFKSNVDTVNTWEQIVAEVSSLSAVGAGIAWQRARGPGTAEGHTG